jgi:hypothetical protein
MLTTTYKPLFDKLPTDCIMIIMAFADNFLKEIHNHNLIETDEFQNKFKQRFLSSEEYENADHQEFKMLFLHNHFINKPNILMSSFYIEEDENDENIFTVIHITYKNIRVDKQSGRRIINKKNDPNPKGVITKVEEQTHYYYEYRYREQVEDDIREYISNEPYTIPSSILYDNLLPQVKERGMTYEALVNFNEEENNEIIGYIVNVEEAIDDYIERDGCIEIDNLNVVEEIGDDECFNRFGFYDDVYLCLR